MEASDNRRVTILAWMVAWALRVLALTWRVRRQDRQLLDECLASGATILAFFHGDQIPVVALHRGLPIAGLASRSRDGELLARVIQRLGYRVFRGSSSKGGVSAGLAAVRDVVGEGLCPALAVDGPRGPRLVPKAGAMALSAWTGRPVLFAVACVNWGFRLHSWDRTVIPLPFSRVEMRYGVLSSPSDIKAEIHAATRELGLKMRVLGGYPEISDPPSVLPDPSTAV